MKQLFVSAVIMIMIAGCTSKPDYIGTWYGKTHNENSITMVFDRDGYATIMIDNVVQGGRELRFKEGVKSTKYAFDWSKKPVWLDCIVYTDDRETYRNEFVVRFTGKDKMLIAPRLKQDPDFEDGTLMTRVK